MSPTCFEIAFSPKGSAIYYIYTYIYCVLQLLGLLAEGEVTGSAMAKSKTKKRARTEPGIALGRPLDDAQDYRILLTVSRKDCRKKCVCGHV